MPRFPLQNHLPALVCAALLALAAALGTHFALKTLYGVPAPAPLEALALANTTATPAWLASGAAAQASDWVLLGVVAGGGSNGQGNGQGNGNGLALLQAVGGDRAKVYTVGQTLPSGAVLKSVDARSASLDVQGSVQTLQLDLKASGAGAAINAQRGVVGFDAAALNNNAIAVPNPMSIPAPVAASAALANAANAASARLAAKRLRAAPGSQEAPNEQAQQP
jgi:hypothetical protein